MIGMNEILSVTDMPVVDCETGCACAPVECGIGAAKMPAGEYAQTQFQPFANEKCEAWQAFAGTSCEAALSRAFEQLGERMAGEDDAGGINAAAQSVVAPVVDAVTTTPAAASVASHQSPIAPTPAVIDTSAVASTPAVIARGEAANELSDGAIAEPIASHQSPITSHQSPIASTPAVIARGEAVNELSNGVIAESNASPRGNLLREGRIVSANGQIVAISDDARSVTEEIAASPGAARRSPRNDGIGVAASHARNDGIGDTDEPITQLPNHPITQLPNQQPITQLTNQPINQLTNTQINQSLRTSAIAIVSAIQVSPTLATTGIGEIRIELSNEILDGSLVRFEVTKGELSITVHPATQEAAQVLEKNLETFQAHLAERVMAWRVNVGVTAWSAGKILKRTEREA